MAPAAVRRRWSFAGGVGHFDGAGRSAAGDRGCGEDGAVAACPDLAGGTLGTEAGGTLSTEDVTCPNRGGQPGADQWSLVRDQVGGRGHVGGPGELHGLHRSPTGGVDDIPALARRSMANPTADPAVPVNTPSCRHAAPSRPAEFRDQPPRTKPQSDIRFPARRSPWAVLPRLRYWHATARRLNGREGIRRLSSGYATNSLHTGEEGHAMVTHVPSPRQGATCGPAPALRGGLRPGDHRRMVVPTVPTPDCPYSRLPKGRHVPRLPPCAVVRSTYQRTALRVRGP